MIIIKKIAYIQYKNLKFRCALGKAGIKKKEKEGDNVTPKGIFKITSMYYRHDRIKNIITAIKKIKIKKNMGWCDDSRCDLYNQQIKLPNKFSYEKLFRNDNLYDLILVLNYNMRPIIKNKGSAIFIHVANKNYKPTQGCISLKKQDLTKILSLLTKKTKVLIN